MKIIALVAIFGAVCSLSIAAENSKLNAPKVLTSPSTTGANKLKDDEIACEKVVNESGAKREERRNYIFRECLLNKGHKLSN
jgi:hypothetical protein